MDVLPWLGVLIVFVIVAGFVIMALRKRLLGPMDSSAQTGSIFEDLNAMHARGDISDEELAAAKRSVVDRLAGRAGPSEKPPAPESRRSDG